VAEVPFDSEAARRYGQIVADLERRGEPIGMADSMIAAHALELDLVVVTHNLRHFERVGGLEIEDWV
jgi:tRNA(fMet)-specific endonuclease VapC